MQMHADDERFELYLKQFRPRAPEPLPVVSQAQLARRVLALGLCAAATVLSAALLMTNWPSHRSRSSTSLANWNPSQTTDFHPLTIRTANQLLAHAPSLKAAMEELMLDSQRTNLPKGQNAFAALSKEDVNP